MSGTSNNERLVMEMKTRKPTGLLAWHFLPKNRCLRYGDGRLVVPGETYSAEPPLKMCSRGMHASVDPIDALSYAPGPVVCRVVLSGEIVRDDDKVCAQHRRVLWMADATETLRAFARLCALDVIRLWDAPDVVRRYLESGDESLREAARAAAWDAAKNAAWDVARYAARDAARDATWDAAWDAAGDAARDAARAAAWDAAKNAAWDAARAAGASAAARDAVWVVQSKRLDEMLLTLDPDTITRNEGETDE